MSSANEEVQSMIYAIRCGIGADQDLSKKRYDPLALLLQQMPGFHGAHGGDGRLGARKEGGHDQAKADDRQSLNIRLGEGHRLTFRPGTVFPSLVKMLH